MYDATTLFFPSSVGVKPRKRRGCLLFESRSGMCLTCFSSSCDAPLLHTIFLFPCRSKLARTLPSLARAFSPFPLFSRTYRSLWAFQKTVSITKTVPFVFLYDKRIRYMQRRLQKQFFLGRTTFFSCFSHERMPDRNERKIGRKETGAKSGPQGTRKGDSHRDRACCSCN